MPTEIAAVAGSLRDRSYTRLALERALDGVEEAGGRGELLDLRTYDLPALNPDIDRETPAASQAAGADGPGDGADEFARRVREADAVLVGTPMYHGSYSGVLKNALDHCGFDEFDGKTVGLLAVSGGSFPVTALEHLRSVCRALNAWVLPHQAAIPRASTAFDGEAFADEGLEDRVLTLGERVVRYAAIEPEPPTFESCENVGAGR